LISIDHFRSCTLSFSEFIIFPVSSLYFSQNQWKKGSKTQKKGKRANTKWQNSESRITVPAGAWAVVVGWDVDGTGVDGTGVDGTGVDGTGVDGTGVDATGVDGTGVGGTGVDG